VNNDKTSPRERGAAGPHRALLRTAAVIFIFLGVMWLLTLAVLPFSSAQAGMTPDVLLEQVVFGLVPVGAGLLLYVTAPRLMD
jgi:hypothetical protein